MDTIKYIQNSLNLYFNEFEKGYKYINKEIKWTQALLVLIIIGIFTGMFSILMEYIYDPSGLEKVGVSIITSLLVSIILIPFGIIISSFISYGILHLLFILFGGKAKFEDTMKFGLSLAIFGQIMSILSSLIPTNLFKSLNQNTTIVLGFALFVIFLSIIIWSIITSIKTFSKLHKISNIKTLFILLIPIISLSIFIIIIIISIFILNTI